MILEPVNEGDEGGPAPGATVTLVVVSMPCNYHELWAKLKCISSAPDPSSPCFTLESFGHLLLVRAHTHTHTAAAATTAAVASYKLHMRGGGYLPEWMSRVSSA